jgi:outer membrane receptor protein involved in Fe transport
MPDVENEEITGFEAGYRFKNRNLKVSLDYYITNWANRFLAFNGPEIDPDGVAQTSTYRLTDVTQRHTGFEFDVEYRPNLRDWSVHVFGSIGNWEYDGDTPYTLQNDETSDFIPQPSDRIDLSGTKVGNAPQTSFGFGGTLKICKGLSVDADYNIFADLYGFVDPEDVAQNALDGGGTYQAEKLPAYTLLDAGVTYKFMFGGKNLTFRANLKNVFNEAYIGQRDAFGYFLGVGRTYNASMRYNF